MTLSTVMKGIGLAAGIVIVAAASTAAKECFAPDARESGSSLNSRSYQYGAPSDTASAVIAQPSKLKNKPHHAEPA